MNPPIHQKPIHHGPLGGKRMRIGFLRLLGFFLVGQPRAIVDYFPVSGWEDAAGGMGWGAEFIWFFEDARFGVWGGCVVSGCVGVLGAVLAG